MRTNQNPGVIGEDESSGLIKFALLHLLSRFLFFGVRCCPGSKEEREEGEMLRCLTRGGGLLSIRRSVNLALGISDRPTMLWLNRELNIIAIPPCPSSVFPPPTGVEPYLCPVYLPPTFGKCLSSCDRAFAAGVRSSSLSFLLPPE